MEQWFSANYARARGRFREAAEKVGFEVEAWPIGENGPDGTPLTIDAATAGAGRRTLILSSGLHGVEGFFGSAVQLAWLDQLDAVPDGLRVVLLHALNPFGFAWLRRVNENNVDLNRNFLLAGEPYVGHPEGYDQLDPTLNPPSAPGPVTTFLPRAVYQIVRRGLGPLKNAVAGGQYDYPNGVFFGGAGPSTTLERLREGLPSLVGASDLVVHVDFHTGLGPPATYKLFVDHPKGAPEVAELGRLFGDDVVEPWSPDKTSYAIRGGLGLWVRELLSEARVELVAAEFGTRHVLRVIQALHHENRAWHWLPRNHPRALVAREGLRDVFAPRQAWWRREVVGKGLAIVAQAIDAATGNVLTATG